MNKSAMLRLAVMIAAVMIFFSSCSGIQFTSAENLIRPPRLSGTDGLLQQAFEKAVDDKGEYILKTPSAGDYRSAFVRYDCDGDGQDEAFVFYSLKAETMSVYMYMFTYSDGRWNAVGDSKGEGSDVYSIDFCDLNNDGVAELLVGWSSIDSKSNKKLSVYCSYKNSQSLNYRVLVIESYTAMHTVDLDRDGEKEIILALINSTSDTYTADARMLKMSKKSDTEFTVEAVGQVGLYSQVTAFLSMVSQESEDGCYLFIDEAADDTYLTQVLYWDEESGTLVSPINVDIRTIAQCPTTRSLELLSKDIDGDSLIEVPSTRLLPSSSIITTRTDSAGAALPAENIYITTYLTMENGEFVSKGCFITNDDDGFRIKYDEETMSDWSALFYPEEGVSQFYEAAPAGDESGESRLLFTVRAVDSGANVSMSSIIYSGETKKYICDITPHGKERGIDLDYLIDIFIQGE